MDQLAYKDVHAAMLFNETLPLLAGPSSFVPSVPAVAGAPLPLLYVTREDLLPLAGPSTFISVDPVLPRVPTSLSYLERSLLGRAESGL
jgi:hypothetical protein